ncbi:MAG: glycosyl hydrolase family 28 protein [Kiritimatiellia bacterium]
MLDLYAAPDDLLQSRIQLWVREAGGAWLPVPVMFASSMSEQPHAYGGSEGWAHLAASGAVECRVRIPYAVHHAAIRPSLRDPLQFRFEARELFFSVAAPRCLVVELNHQAVTGRNFPRNTLYLMINAPEDAAPVSERCRVLEPGLHAPEAFDPGECDGVYLLPGVHEVTGQMVDLYSHKFLYLSGGAHLRSYIRGEGVEHAALRGPGVIDGTGVALKSIEWRDDGDAAFVFFRRGKHNRVDGPVIYDSPFWNLVTFGTTGTVIRNHKAITWQVNNDGIQPRSCNDLLVENCFLKCADDCVAVKTRRAAGMQSRNLRFRNLICWNDLPGNALEIGHTSQADLLEDVRFENIEVIHSEENHTLSLTVIDHCTVRDIHYDGLYVEGVRNEDVKLLISTSRYSTDPERGHIRDIHIRNYHTASALRGGSVEGYDANHLIENIHMQNVVEHAGTAEFRALESLADLKLYQRHCCNLSYTPIISKPSVTMKPVVEVPSTPTRKNPMTNEHKPTDATAAPALGSSIQITKIINPPTKFYN